MPESGNFRPQSALLNNHTEVTLTSSYSCMDLKLYTFTANFGNCLCLFLRDVVKILSLLETMFVKLYAININ